MKKIALYSLCLVLFFCSKDEETQAPTSTVQGTTPEPEPETPAPVVVQYTLTVTAGEGGSVTDGGTFDDGTEVIITASPIEGYRFTGWEGNSSTSESLTVTLSSNQTYEALFELIPLVVSEYTLSITAGEGGTVTTGGTYDKGAEVTLTATANEGYQFIRWDNGIPDLSELDSNDYNIENTNILIGSFTRKPIENGYHEVEIINENGQLKWRNKAGVSWSLELRDGKLWTRADNPYGEQLLGVFTPNNQDVLALTFNNELYENELYESLDLASESLTFTLNSNQTYEALFQEEYIYEYNQLNLNEPPFGGTIFITGDIITSSDPSLFDKIEYDGIFLRNIYDRRLEETSQGPARNLEVYVYTNYYSDGTTIETLVNPEFTLEESRIETEKMAFLIGQLPYALRRDLRFVVVNKGLNPWGGGGGGIIIHTEQTAQYEINEYWDGIGYNSNYVADISQETLIHEAAHTSLDARYYPDRLTDGEKWLEAVALDGGCYISDYARDNPLREDIAELFLLYIAVRYFPERISDDLRDKILSCAYNRIKYFDSLGLDMSLYEN